MIIVFCSFKMNIAYNKNVFGAVVDSHHIIWVFNFCLSLEKTTIMV